MRPRNFVLPILAAATLFGCGGSTNEYTGRAQVTTWNFLYPSSGTSSVEIQQFINGLAAGKINFNGGSIFPADFIPASPVLAVEIKRSSDNSLVTTGSTVPTLNGRYNAFVLGTLGSTTTPPRLVFSANGVAPATGKTSIRPFHTLPGVSSVDFYIQPVGSTAAPTKINAGTSFGNIASRSDLNAGSYKVFVTRGGVAQNNTTDLIQSTVNLSAGINYYLAAGRNSPGTVPVLIPIAER